VSDEDAKLGARARDLLRSLSMFADMLAVSAPTSVLARQAAEMEQIAREVDAMAGSGLFDGNAWSVITDMANLMRVYELIQQRQADSADSE
jgi:hypothetical protein